MDESATTAQALQALNALHRQFMELLTETLDAAEDGIALLEGAKLGVSYVQASVAILGALKRLSPEVRTRLRTIAPQTHFVYDEAGAQP